MSQQPSEPIIVATKITGRLLLAILLLVASACAGFGAFVLNSLRDWGSMRLCVEDCPVDDGYGNALGLAILASLGVQAVVGLVWAFRGGRIPPVSMLGILAFGVVDFLVDLGGRTLATPAQLTHSLQSWLKLWLFVAAVAIAAAGPGLAYLVARIGERRRTAREFA